jgi:hypothetical protein
LLDDPTDVSRAQRDNLSGDQSRVSMTNSKDLHAMVESYPDHRADGGVHARGVAPAGHHRNPLHDSSAS